MRIDRRSDQLSLGSLFAMGLIAAVAALLAISAQAQGATQLDYGDAPDGASAGYSIAVTGEFPSLLASSGPRHRSSGPSLGVGRDGEGDSKQVNRDRFDDGVSLERLGRCKTSVLTVLIDTRRIPERLLRKRDLYLNSWFDWDRSGVWGETNGCPNAEPLRNNEWAIVNQRISGKAFLKERVRAFSIKFKAGLHSQEFWTRVSLTLGQKLPIDAASRSGGATDSPYAYGETEDYLIRGGFGPPPEFPDRGGKKKETKKEKEEKEKEEEEIGPFRVSCLPNPATVEHGKAVKVRFSVVDEGKGPIFGRTLSKKSTPDYRTRILRSSNQKGVPTGYFRAAGFSFRSKKRDKRANPVERHVVSFSFVRGKVKQMLKCAVTVIHEKIVKPKKPHKPPPVQPLQPQAPGGGQAPSAGQSPSGGEQQPVNGSGLYQLQETAPGLVHLAVQFDQDVEGFRIKLTPGLPPFEILNPQDVPGSLKCEVAPDKQSMLCTGSIKANVQLIVAMQVNPPPNSGVLDGRLQLCAIQGGAEKGPFPVAMAPSLVTK
jgi:hypothetical protein